ncbi:methyltransferase domain-containing protein [Azonexus sp.]|jgi:SAM-dependent methyltransferase|uniref:methyltransferase domain-containing protein n=1 Tax=Azonexus sp. TaxID=1872668 RepID=UPI002821CEAE|nr:methyltransferase domain-containing protein [Azonexus sp.]MDR1995925.1 class I SAM-dependent methyltransferase [Azonexus sp.]
MADEKLYESAAVWDQQLQLGQRNLIQAICDYWPDGVRTVLDVGCGDGKITHVLAERTKASFHGFDGSREALSRLRLPSTHGDISKLPFDDQIFDLVLTTDVFEHLPDEIEHTAWREIFRVARDWVFFAVPFREELLDATTICSRCGKHYHVNWHRRAYDFANLSNRTPAGWVLTDIVLSGESWSPMLPPETAYRRAEMDEWSGWTEAVCPSCGEPSYPAVPTMPLSADVARALGRYLYEAVVSERRFIRSHSEIIGIFCRTGLDLQKKSLVPENTLELSAARWISRVGVLAGSLDPYPQTAKMVTAVDGGCIVQFPVYPGNLQRLSFVGCRPQHVALVVEDGCGLLFSGEIILTPGCLTELALPRAVKAGYYGLLVRIPSFELFESISLDGAAPAVRHIFPDEGQTTYYAVPDTTIRIQATRPFWLDCASLIEPSGPISRLNISAVRALVQLERELEAAGSSNAQLQSELEAARSSNAQLQLGLERLKQRYEVRFGERIRRCLPDASKT